MIQDVNLIVYHSPLLAAHWSLYFPNPFDPTRGKRIHVTGDVLHGFEHDIDRVYNLAVESRSFSVEPIADVAEDVLDHSTTTTPGEGGDGSPIAPRDRVEEIALRIPAPGPSLNPVSHDVRMPSDFEHVSLVPQAETDQLFISGVGFKGARCAV
jgi:hypothetical protein